MAYHLAVLYFAAFAVHGVFLAGSALAARQLGVPIVAVRLGLGPKLFTRGTFELRLFPISGFVRMFDTRADDVHERKYVDQHVEQAFDRQPRLVRALLMLSGPLATLLAAIALRGNAGWHSFLRAFEQLLSGAIAPASRGVELTAGYLHVAQASGFIAALGVLMAKVSAVNLLPIPIIGGGAALFELLCPNVQPQLRDRMWLWAQHIGLVAMLALVVPWLFAVALALRPATFLRAI